MSRGPARPTAAAWLLALAATCWHAPALAQTGPGGAGERSETLAHGLFDEVLVVRPAGAVERFVLLLSGLDGVSAADRRRAQAMAATGAMVAAVDVARFYPRLEAEGGRCGYADGAFENLSHHVQAYFHLPVYLTPMLVGRSVGGTLAYAMLAQAAPGTFASALSAGFCPELPFELPLCAAHALRCERNAAPRPAGHPGSRLQPGGPLPAPWIVVGPTDDAACPAAEAQAFVERVPQARWQASSRGAAGGAARGAADAEAAFRAAYAQLARRAPAPQAPPTSLADLPIVEVAAAAPAAAAADLPFAVLISGDGGWAGIDKDLGAALARRGVPVAGFDSLRYFWSPRTPEGLAADLDRVIRYHAARWGRDEVLLIGYSQGADVLPFALNRLPAATRARVRLTALLGPGQKASFEFHVANWVGKGGDRPIAPEAERLTAAQVLCVHGTDERDSLCPQLAPDHARVLPLKGGHHFDGDYDKLARLILEAMPPR